MKRSLIFAIVVEVIVLVAAFAFTLSYLLFGMWRETLILNMVLVIVWVLVAGIFLAVFWWRSLVREEMVRRFYVSDKWVYNYEIGYAPLGKVITDGDAYGFVTFAADALAKMSYGFEVAENPENFKPRFLITSNEFRFHFSGGDDEMGEEAEGVVVDAWKGTLQRIDRSSVANGVEGAKTYSEVGTFGNAGELARLLEDAGVFESDEDQQPEGAEGAAQNGTRETAAEATASEAAASEAAASEDAASEATADEGAAGKAAAKDAGTEEDGTE